MKEISAPNFLQAEVILKNYSAVNTATPYEKGKTPLRVGRTPTEKDQAMKRAMG